MKNHKKDEKRAFIYGLKAENMKKFELAISNYQSNICCNFQNISGRQVS